MKKHFIASCAILILLSVRGLASAFSPTSLANSPAPYDITSAWDFQLTQSFLVTALDYYDSGAAGGLLTSHQVGLWTSNGVLLSSVTIPAGTAAPLIGNYRSVAITPIILMPGYYEVGGFVSGNSDKYVYDATGTTQAGILYFESHVAIGAFAFAGSQNLSSTTEITANFEAAPYVATATVTGSIALDGVNDLAATNPAVPVGNITFDFFAANTATHISPLFTKAAALSPVSGTNTGTFSLSGVTVGSYDIGIATSKSLRTIVKNVNANSNVALPGVTTLLGGNANSDNTVNFDDFLVLLNAFGSNVSDLMSGFDPKADFTYDGNINFDDFLVLLGNFGAVSNP